MCACEQVCAFVRVCVCVCVCVGVRVRVSLHVCVSVSWRVWVSVAQHGYNPVT